MSNELLLQKITPLYNSYQAGLKTHTPVQLLAYMWDIGAELAKHIDLNKIPPHTLYRQIYGKGEGTQNVKQRSYIPREFLGRSYRVNRIFTNKTDIANQLSGLTAINHFREAMPFFDNPKYVLDAKEKMELLRIMTGNISNKDKQRYIRELQARKIGIKNPRTQQLSRLDDDKLVFVKFYNDVFHALKQGDYERAGKELGLPSAKFISILSLNCGAISADGLMMEKFEIPSKLPTKWQGFSKVLKRLVDWDTPKERRRFRRLIPSERMVRLSEMLYALTSRDRFDNFAI